MFGTVRRWLPALGLPPPEFNAAEASWQSIFSTMGRNGQVPDDQLMEWPSLPKKSSGNVQRGSGQSEGVQGVDMIENPPVNPIIGQGRTANQVTARHIRATFRGASHRSFRLTGCERAARTPGELSRSGPIFGILSRLRHASARADWSDDFGKGVPHTIRWCRHTRRRARPHRVCTHRARRTGVWVHRQLPATP